MRIEVKYAKNSRAKLEVKPWGVLITLREGVREDEINKIVERHRAWIEKKYSELLESVELSKNIELVTRSEAEFKSLLEEFVKQAREILGVNPRKIVIRKMKTRWGSCNHKKGTITVNALAAYLPEHLISYIIYHEICHLIEPKHNGIFLEHIRRRYPNYKELEKELIAYEIKLRSLE